MNLTHYVFHSVWHVEAAPVDVMPVLYDLESYQEWWPEIRSVKPLGGARFEVLARSILPYELRFVSDAAAFDSDSGVIDAGLTGDLDGTVRWTVSHVGDKCRLVYDQQVTTHKRLLNAMAPVARAGFRANHSIMMRHGEAGLRTYMAGFRRGAGTGAGQ